MAGKILVLDDEPDYAKLLRNQLQRERYDVDIVHSPVEALGILEEKRYELVIADFKMPQMDGADFIENARKVNPELPVIMISGLMNTPDLVRVANIGVTLVLEKPFDAEKLLEYVSRFVKPGMGTKSQGQESGADRLNNGVIQYAENDSGLTLPGKPEFVEARSPAMQRFLHKVDAQVESGGASFVTTPRGAEIEGLIKQVAAWRGCGDPVRMTLQEWSRRDNAKLTALTWVVIDEAVSASDWINLSEWLSCPDAVQKQAKAAVFDFVLPRPEDAAAPDALKKRIEKEQTPMPTLGSRMADIAGMAIRAASPGGQPADADSCLFTKEGILWVLTYSWPGEVEELDRVIASAAASAGGKPIDCAMLEAALGSPRKAPESATLEDFLRRRQTEYLKEIAPKLKNSLGATLASAGVDPKHAGNASSVEALDLLFPELL